MRRSKFVSAVALLSGVALALSACGGGSEGQDNSNDPVENRPGAIGEADDVFERPAVEDSGEFVFATEETLGDYNNNIGATNNFANTEVLNQVQPSPYYYDQVDGTVYHKLDGDLMTRVEVTSTDPQVVEWEIRKEAIWSDDTPVSCKDFYLQWLAGATPLKGEGEDAVSIFDVGPTGYEDIDTVECSEDGKTITTTFGTAFADYRALFQFMMPAHVLEANVDSVDDITQVEPSLDDPAIEDVATFYTEGWLGLDPERSLSAGPYTIDFDDSELRRRIVMLRNEKWWANTPGPSKITVIQNADGQSMLQQIQNKEVTLASPQADGALAIQAYGDSNIDVYAAPGLLYEHLDMNMERPIFQHEEIRRAFATCVPGPELVENLIADVDPNSKPLSSLMFMPNEVGYEEHYTDVATGDAEAAKKILEDAGWELGPDGIYAKDGEKAEFEIGHKIVTRRADTVRLVQNRCREAGIAITPYAADEFNDKDLPASDFDVALFAWVGVPVKSSANGVYMSKDAGGSANYNNYSNPEADKLMKEANGELDFDKRIEMLNEIDQIMAEDLHSIPLFLLPDFGLAQAGVGPLKYVGAQGGLMSNAFEWQRS